MWRWPLLQAKILEAANKATSVLQLKHEQIILRSLRPIGSAGNCLVVHLFTVYFFYRNAALHILFVADIHAGQDDGVSPL